MDNKELLSLYLEKLQFYSLEKLETEDISVLEALKVSFLYLEGEMSGY